jgi:hypothetical protein
MKVEVLECKVCKGEKSTRGVSFLLNHHYLILSRIAVAQGLSPFTHGRKWPKLQRLVLTIKVVRA